MNSLIKQLSTCDLSRDQLLPLLESHLEKKHKNTDLAWVEVAKRLLTRAADEGSEALFRNASTIVKMHLNGMVRRGLRNPKKFSQQYLSALNSLLTHLRFTMEDTNLPLEEVHNLSSLILAAIIDVTIAARKKGEESSIVSKIFMKLTLVFGHFQEHLLDALLHCRTLIRPSSRQPSVQVPLIKCLFSTLLCPRSLNPVLYLKYLLLGKLWLFMTEKKELCTTRTYIAKMLRVPEGVDEWAESRDVSWLDLPELDTRLILKNMTLTEALETFYGRDEETSGGCNQLGKSKKKKPTAASVKNEPGPSKLSKNRMQKRKTKNTYNAIKSEPGEVLLTASVSELESEEDEEETVKVEDISDSFAIDADGEVPYAWDLELESDDYVERKVKVENISGTVSTKKHDKLLSSSVVELDSDEDVKLESPTLAVRECKAADKILSGSERTKEKGKGQRERMSVEAVEHKSTKRKAQNHTDINNGSAEPNQKRKKMKLKAELELSDIDNMDTKKGAKIMSKENNNKNTECEDTRKVDLISADKVKSDKTKWEVLDTESKKVKSKTTTTINYSEKLSQASDSKSGTEYATERTNFILKTKELSGKLEQLHNLKSQKRLRDFAVDQDSPRRKVRRQSERAEVCGISLDEEEQEERRASPRKAKKLKRLQRSMKDSMTFIVTDLEKKRNSSLKRQLRDKKEELYITESSGWRVTNIESTGWKVTRIVQPEKESSLEKELNDNSEDLRVCVTENSGWEVVGDKQPERDSALEELEDESEELCVTESSGWEVVSDEQPGDSSLEEELEDGSEELCVTESSGWEVENTLQSERDIPLEEELKEDSEELFVNEDSGWEVANVVQPDSASGRVTEKEATNILRKGSHSDKQKLKLEVTSATGHSKVQHMSFDKHDSNTEDTSDESEVKAVSEDSACDRKQEESTSEGIIDESEFHLEESSDSNAESSEEESDEKKVPAVDDAPVLASDKEACVSLEENSESSKADNDVDSSSQEESEAESENPENDSLCAEKEKEVNNLESEPSAGIAELKHNSLSTYSTCDINAENNSSNLSSASEKWSIQAQNTSNTSKNVSDSNCESDSEIISDCVETKPHKAEETSFDINSEKTIDLSTSGQDESGEWSVTSMEKAIVKKEDSGPVKATKAQDSGIICSPHTLEVPDSESDIEVVLDEVTGSVHPEAVCGGDLKLKEEAVQREVERILKEDEEELKRQREIKQASSNVKNSIDNPKPSLPDKSRKRRGEATQDPVSKLFNNLYKSKVTETDSGGKDDGCMAGQDGKPLETHPSDEAAVTHKESVSHLNENHVPVHDDDEESNKSVETMECEEEIESVLKNIVKDTGRLTSIQGLRERLLSESNVQEELRETANCEDKEGKEMKESNDPEEDEKKKASIETTNQEDKEIKETSSLENIESTNQEEEEENKEIKETSNQESMESINQEEEKEAKVIKETSSHKEGNDDEVKETTNCKTETVEKEMKEATNHEEKEEENEQRERTSHNKEKKEEGAAEVGTNRKQENDREAVKGSEVSLPLNPSLKPHLNESLSGTLYRDVKLEKPVGDQEDNESLARSIVKDRVQMAGIRELRERLLMTPLKEEATEKTQQEAAGNDREERECLPPTSDSLDKTAEENGKDRQSEGMSGCEAVQDNIKCSPYKELADSIDIKDESLDAMLVREETENTADGRTDTGTSSTRHDERGGGESYGKDIESQSDMPPCTDLDTEEGKENYVLSCNGVEEIDKGTLQTSETETIDRNGVEEKDRGAHQASNTGLTDTSGVEEKGRDSHQASDTGLTDASGVEEKDRDSHQASGTGPTDTSGVEEKDRDSHQAPDTGPTDTSGVEEKGRDSHQASDTGLTDTSGVEEKDRDSHQASGTGPTDTSGVEEKDRASHQASGTGPTDTSGVEEKDRDSHQASGTGPTDTSGVEEKGRSSHQASNTGLTDTSGAEEEDRDSHQASNTGLTDTSGVEERDIGSHQASDTGLTDTGGVKEKDRDSHQASDTGLTDENRVEELPKANSLVAGSVTLRESESSTEHELVIADLMEKVPFANGSSTDSNTLRGDGSSAELDSVMEEFGEKSADGADDAYEASSDASEDSAPRTRRRSRSLRKSCAHQDLQRASDSDSSPVRAVCQRTSTVDTAGHQRHRKKRSQSCCLENVIPGLEYHDRKQTLKACGNSTFDIEKEHSFNRTFTIQTRKSSYSESSATSQATCNFLQEKECVTPTMSNQDTSSTQSDINTSLEERKRCTEVPQGCKSDSDLPHVKQRRRSREGESQLKMCTSASKSPRDAKSSCSMSPQTLQSRYVKECISPSRRKSREFYDYATSLCKANVGGSDLVKESSDAEDLSLSLSLSCIEEELTSSESKTPVNENSSHSGNSKMDIESQKSASLSEGEKQKSLSEVNDTEDGEFCAEAQHLETRVTHNQSETVQQKSSKHQDTCKENCQSKNNVGHEINEELVEEFFEGEEMEVLSTSGIEEEDEEETEQVTPGAVNDNDQGTVVAKKADFVISKKSLRSHIRKLCMSKDDRELSNEAASKDRKLALVPVVNAQRLSEVALTKEVLISPDVSDEECELVSPGIDLHSVKYPAEEDSLEDSVHHKNANSLCHTNCSLQKSGGGILSPHKTIPEEQDESTVARNTDRNSLKVSSLKKAKTSNNSPTSMQMTPHKTKPEEQDESTVSLKTRENLPRVSSVKKGKSSNSSPSLSTQTTPHKAMAEEQDESTVALAARENLPRTSSVKKGRNSNSSPSLSTQTTPQKVIAEEQDQSILSKNAKEDLHKTSSAKKGRKSSNTPPLSTQATPHKTIPEEQDESMTPRNIDGDSAKTSSVKRRRSSNSTPPVLSPQTTPHKASPEEQHKSMALSNRNGDVPKTSSVKKRRSSNSTPPLSTQTTPYKITPDDNEKSMASRNTDLNLAKTSSVKRCRSSNSTPPLSTQTSPYITTPEEQDKATLPRITIEDICKTPSLKKTRSSITPPSSSSTEKLPERRIHTRRSSRGQDDELPSSPQGSDTPKSAKSPTKTPKGSSNTTQEEGSVTLGPGRVLDTPRKRSDAAQSQKKKDHVGDSGEDLGSIVCKNDLFSASVKGTRGKGLQVDAPSSTSRKEPKNRRSASSERVSVYLQKHNTELANECTDERDHKQIEYNSLNNASEGILKEEYRMDTRGKSVLSSVSEEETGSDASYQSVVKRPRGRPSLSSSQSSTQTRRSSRLMKHVSGSSSLTEDERNRDIPSVSSECKVETVEGEVQRATPSTPRRSTRTASILRKTWGKSD